MPLTLCVIPGDGIGQEVIPVAVRVLQTVLPDLEISEAKAGWAVFEGSPALPCLKPHLRWPNKWGLSCLVPYLRHHI